jgi:hypothetical protein
MEECVGFLLLFYSTALNLVSFYKFVVTTHPANFFVLLWWGREGLLGGLSVRVAGFEGIRSLTGKGVCGA